MKTIHLPASKSYAQRYIIGGLLSTGTVRLSGVAKGELSEDIEAAIGAVGALGAKISWIDTETIEITGTGGGLQGNTTVDVGESGFCARAFSVVGGLAGNSVEITGKGSLMKRNWGVEDVLKQMTFTQSGQLQGGEFTVDGSISSQVLSGLLMTLPLAVGDSTIRVRELKSKPYVDMTLKVLDDFGIAVENVDYQEFKINGGQKYGGGEFMIERDWSAASYFVAAGAIHNLELSFPGLNTQSLQSDKAILQAVDMIGRGRNAITFDATDCPDLVPTLVSLCSFLDGESTIYGIERLYHKESSRGVVLQGEWAKFGVEVRLEGDTRYVNGVGRGWWDVVIDPHGDHRIAMAAMVMGEGVEVADVGVVDKSFRGFFGEFSKLGLFF